MAKRTARIAALSLALLLAAGVLCGCAAVKKGADVVASLFKGKGSSASQGAEQGEQGEKKGGLLDLLQNGPEPTPPPSNKELFARTLKDVFLNVVDESDKLESMQLQLLFDPTMEVDNTRSGRVHMVLDLTAEGEDSGLFLDVESLNDVKTGDASFKISGGEGEESAKTGGVYFTGDSMLVKRGDTSKKLIRYPVDAAQAKSYKGLSAIDRLGRILGGGKEPKKEKADWEKSIDDYLAVIAQNSGEDEYSQASEDVALLGSQKSCPAVALSVKGEQAHAMARGLADLIEQENFVQTAMKSREDDGTGIGDLKGELDAMTDSEIAELSMLMSAYTFDGEPVGFRMSLTDAEDSIGIGFVFYKKGFERDMRLTFETREGAFSLTSSNVSAGGDQYIGETAMTMSEPDGTRTALKASAKSTITETSLTSDVSFALDATQVDDDGASESSTTSGSMSWSQQKDASGSVTAKGSGKWTLDLGDETATLDVDMTLEQVYEDVAVDAPKFIQSAGIDVSDTDALLEALDIDKEEFEEAPLMQRALMSLFILIG